MHGWGLQGAQLNNKFEHDDARLEPTPVGWAADKPTGSCARRPQMQQL